MMHFDSVLAALRDDVDGNLKFRRLGWANVVYISVMPPIRGGKMDRPYIYAHDLMQKNSPWLASQVDLFADDWELMKPEDGNPKTLRL